MGEQETIKLRKIAILILLPLLLCSFLSVGYSQATLNTGLVGHWKLDEGTGIIAYETTGLSNTGELTATATWLNGKWNDAVGFNAGSSDRITIPSNNNLRIAGNFTISLWFNTTSATNVGLLSKGTSYTNLNYYLYVNSAAKLVGSYANGTAQRTITSSASVNDGYWHNAILIFDSTNLYLYLDGVSATVAVSSIGTPVTSTANLYISYEGFNGYYGTSSIDDVRIYNRVLSSDEVTEMQTFDPDTPDPTATPSPTPTPSTTLGATVTEGDMSNTDWWISILVLLLIIINIFLMMLPFALVRFTFGILSLFLCMLALSYAIPLSPYLQTAGLLISALAMLFSVRARE